MLCPDRCPRLLYAQLSNAHRQLSLLKKEHPCSSMAKSSMYQEFSLSSRVNVFTYSS